MDKIAASTLGLNINEVENLLDQYRGLPLHTYYDPGVYEFEVGAVFDRAWHYLCPLEKLAHPGDVITDTVGRTPVIVTRGQDGQLHGMVNSCRHRGYRVVRTNRLGQTPPSSGTDYGGAGVVASFRRMGNATC